MYPNSEIDKIIDDIKSLEKNIDIQIYNSNIDY